MGKAKIIPHKKTAPFIRRPFYMVLACYLKPQHFVVPNGYRTFRELLFADLRNR